jgi:hypothetical protein
MSTSITKSTLTAQFKAASSNIEIYGPKLDRAVAAHQEIRDVLANDERLLALGADPVLIGSYARRTGIYPGKDVDVFVRLMKLSTDEHPKVAYDAVLKPLREEYGARVTEQPRSVKVDFEPTGPGKSDGFSVDVVPAVPLGEEWALPVPDPKDWTAAGEAWVATNPTNLTDLSIKRNEQPKVGEQGAYKPAVKMVRQIRKHHLDDAKPGGLYFELLTYRVFEQWTMPTSSWAELVREVLDGLASLLEEGYQLINPADDRAYAPAPSPEERSAASVLFRKLSNLAGTALEADRCMAAKHWREIFGTNDRGEVFPLPEGCTIDGKVMATVSAVPARGSNEAGGFGRD